MDNSTINQTLNEVAEKIEPQNWLDKAGEWLSQNIKPSLSWLGGKATSISGYAVKEFDLGTLSFKLLILILLVGSLLLVNHISRKPLKIALIILIALFIVSIVASFFF